MPAARPDFAAPTRPRAALLGALIAFVALVVIAATATAGADERSTAGAPAATH